MPSGPSTQAAYQLVTVQHALPGSASWILTTAAATHWVALQVSTSWDTMPKLAVATAENSERIQVILAFGKALGNAGHGAANGGAPVQP
jgi:hypothetical protein